MIFLFLLSSITLSAGQEYSFCSGDRLFSFSGKSCPGGVILKEAIKIDEPCFCFGADLKIYEDCKSEEGVLKTATFPGCQAPLIQPSDKWSGKAKYFLPSENFTQKPVGEFEFCPKIRDTCLRLDQINSTISLDPNDITSEDQRRKVRQGSACLAFDDCTDEKTPIVNDISNMLTYIQNKERLIIISNVFKLLKLSVEIFKSLSPEWMVPATTMDNIFNIFHLKFLALDSIRADRHMREDTYVDLKFQLEKCLSETKELKFVEDKSSCPPKVGKLVYINETLGQTVTMDAEIPDDRKYKKEEEDLLIGVLWKVVDTVHTKCFLYNHYYFTNMEDIFLNPAVLSKHYTNNGYGMLLYAGIVDHDNMDVFAENVDKIDAAVHSTAKFPVYFQKPRRDLSQNGNSAASSIRKKRSTETKYIEIWGGRAYCLLQKQNLTTLTSNPELKNLCEETPVPKNPHCIPTSIKGDALKNVSMNCTQEGLEMKSGFYRIANNVTENCCYDPMKCSDAGNCTESCKTFCTTMKSEYLSSENSTCNCTHSQEFVKLKDAR